MKSLKFKIYLFMDKLSDSIKSVPVYKLRKKQDGIKIVTAACRIKAQLENEFKEV